MAHYKIGDFVTFEPTSDDIGYENEGTHYDFWFDNQIEEILDNDHYVFADFNGEWEESIISGHSPDYRPGEDGVYDIRIDDV